MIHAQDTATSFMKGGVIKGKEPRHIGSGGSGAAWLDLHSQGYPVLPLGT